jgi:hypothetical protein
MRSQSLLARLKGVVRNLTEVRLFSYIHRVLITPRYLRSPTSTKSKNSHPSSSRNIPFPANTATVLSHYSLILRISRRVLSYLMSAFSHISCARSLILTSILVLLY